MVIGSGSVKKIDNGLKRFNLKHSDSEGKIINSDENIIIFFEKNEKQKVVKIRDKGKLESKYSTIIRG